MSSEAFRIMTVAHIIALSDKPVLLCPGLPKDPQRTIRVGDKIELRRPDGTRVSTILAGIEHAKMLNGVSQWPLRLPNSIGTIDVPVGTEVWWISSEKS
jgi:hypothetical protein